MRILSVEDNADHQELMSLTLTGHDPTWQVEEVASGEEALRRLTEGEAYDLVFLDYSLPELDGLEVLEEIRRGKAPPPVVMVTGLGDEEVAVEAMKRGAYDYVVKGVGYLQRLPVVARRAMEAHQLGVERKRAEEVLRESEERFRRLYERAPLGYQSLDAEGCFIDVNQAWLDLLGYSRDQVIGRWFGDFLAPQELDSFKERFLRFKATGEVHVDVEMVQRAGSTIIVHIDGRIGQDKHGQFKQTHCILHDITERKRAEKALREREARYRELADSIDDVFFAFDKDLRYTYWNKASEKLTGTPTKDAIGKSLYELFPDTPQTREAERAYLDVLGTQQPQTFVTEYQLGGKDLFFEISAYPSRDGLSVFVKDITQRKRAEEELRQSHVNLQRALEGTVHTLVSAIEMRDPYTGSHQRRVTQLACAIANEMGLPEEQTVGLRMAGLIHDLGKITVPAEILSKPAPLTELEFGLIKMHPQIGYDVLKEMDFPWPVAQIVLQHHERMDGSGYPQGLSGEEIILEARILGVADVVEAMVSHRPYRPAHSIEDALEEISQNRGVLYDAEVADACLKLFTERRFKFE